MPNSTTPEVTPADQWKPQEGFPLTLPSGRTVKMRRSLDIFDMMQDGNVPNALKGIVEEALKSGDPTKLSKENVSPDDMFGMITFVDTVVLKIVQEPKVRANPEREPGEEDSDYEERIDSTSPGPGAIWLKWMDIEDRLFIFSVAQGGDTDIARFREELLGNVGTVSDVAEVPKPTKRTGGASKKRK